MRTVKTHTLQAKTIDGRWIEVGTVSSLERAARLLEAMARELGDEYREFQVLEREETVRIRALTREELRIAS